MTEYSTLWDAGTSTFHVIAKDDYENYWYMFATMPDEYRAREVADALNAKEAQLD